MAEKITENTINMVSGETVTPEGPNTGKKRKSWRKLWRLVRTLLYSLLLIVAAFAFGGWWWLGLLLIPVVIDAMLLHIVPWRPWRKSRSYWVRALMATLEAALKVSVVVWVVMWQFGRIAIVDTQLMQSTLQQTDRVWVSRMPHSTGSWSSQQLQRGDVVETSNGEFARVVALPGETIEIDGDDIIVNGHMLEQPLSVMHRYIIQTDGREINAGMWRDMGLANRDHERLTLGGTSRVKAQQLGLQVGADGKLLPAYSIAMSDGERDNLSILFPWVIGSLHYADVMGTDTTQQVTRRRLAVDELWVKSDNSISGTHQQGFAVKRADLTGVVTRIIMTRDVNGGWHRGRRLTEGDEPDTVQGNE